MAWKKSPQALIDLLEEILPDDPRAERKKMFGYPCSFVHGNLWIGLHEDNLLLRLDEASRKKFLALADARVFEPMPGRTMKEYVVAPPDLLEEPKELRRWVARAFAYALELPAKEPRKKAAAKKTAAPPKKKTAARPAKKKAQKA